MNKLQIKKMLSARMIIVNRTNKTIAINSWKRAKAIAEIHNMIIWKESPYKSFRAFCNEEFPQLATTSMACWVGDYNFMSKLYSWKEITKIADAMAFTKSIKLAKSRNKKLSVANLIKLSKLKDPPKTRQNNTLTGVPCETRIVFTMPSEYIEQLEALLSNYGYVIPNSKYDNKHGISDAMMMYLDTI